MKFSLLILVSYFASILLLSCSSEQVMPEQVPMLVWEDVKTFPSEAKVSNSEWSKFVFKKVDEKFSDFIKAKDVSQYCPKFSTLNHGQQVTVFSQLIAAISKYESSWNPKSGMVETSMGVDPVTKLPVKSVGLLQLSYQDQPNWKSKAPACEPMSYEKKNITDVELNLGCGIEILGKLIAKDSAISSSSARRVGGGRYWSVLWFDKKQTNIIKLVSRLSFCN
jgi:hypothetical protein